MSPHLVEYGKRYGDDSGWENRLTVDTQRGSGEGRVEIELGGSELSCTIEQLRWLVIQAHAAFDVLCFDKIVPEGPQASDAGVKDA